MSRVARRSSVGVVVALILAASCQGDYSVQVPGGHVSLSRTFWKPMENPEAFAENFESRKNRPGEVYGQVITVFKSAIREDQRTGLILAPNTWVEFMIVHPDQVTAQVRVSHGAFWVLSRQTFTKRPDLTVDISRYNPFLPSEASRVLYLAYIDEIDRTRSVLTSMTATP